MRPPVTARIALRVLRLELALLAGLALGGCSVDYYAHTLIEQNTAAGKCAFGGRLGIANRSPGA